LELFVQENSGKNVERIIIQVPDRRQHSRRVPCGDSAAFNLNALTGRVARVVTSICVAFELPVKGRREKPLTVIA
jgi:hypothetical protein